MFDEKTTKRFWSSVKVSEKDSCWIWSGYINRDGYGNFNVNNTVINSHRVSYMIFYGEIPRKMCVCHKCDNPSCVNPSHLFLDTHSGNMRDMAIKGRSASHKLSEKQKEEIRKSGKTPKELSAIYKIGGRHISRIIKNS